MAAAKVARVSTSLLSVGSLGTAGSQGRSLAEAFDQHSLQRNMRQQDAVAQPAESATQSVRKLYKKADGRTAVIAERISKQTLHLHIGGDLQIPVRESKYVHPSREEQEQAAAASHRDPFEGLPLKAWAEKLGERVMPAYELIKEEQAAAKRAAKALGKKVEQELAVPSIPHLLPFTRWAANSKVIQNTFVAEEGKDKKKARLSWYHPDDTMVPRDWFRGGLLKDLAYYKPFST